MNGSKRRNTTRKGNPLLELAGKSAITLRIGATSTVLQPSVKKGEIMSISI